MNMVEEAGKMVYNSLVIRPDDREGVLKQIVAVLKESGAVTDQDIQDYRAKYGMKIERSGRETKRTVRHPNGEMVVIKDFGKEIVRDMEIIGDFYISYGDRFDPEEGEFNYIVAGGIEGVYRKINKLPFLSFHEACFLEGIIEPKV